MAEIASSISMSALSSCDSTTAQSFSRLYHSEDEAANLGPERIPRGEILRFGLALKSQMRIVTKGYNSWWNMGRVGAEMARRDVHNEERPSLRRSSYSYQNIRVYILP
jgi:hypothetical protein